MLELPADPGLTMLVYTAEPGSPSADALTLARQLGRDAGAGCRRRRAGGRAELSGVGSLSRP